MKQPRCNKLSNICLKQMQTTSLCIQTPTYHATVLWPWLLRPTRKSMLYPRRGSEVRIREIEILQNETAPNLPTDHNFESKANAGSPVRGISPNRATRILDELGHGSCDSEEDHQATTRPQADPDSPEFPTDHDYSLFRPGRPRGS